MSHSWLTKSRAIISTDCAAAQSMVMVVAVRDSASRSLTTSDVACSHSIARGFKPTALISPNRGTSHEIGSAVKQTPHNGEIRTVDFLLGFAFPVFSSPAVRCASTSPASRER
ncbi:hypothetical protein M5K25_021970 [Dendrobium thyrsiflorum]|uniref:Secreted protein n=1 Tax=Dendrobium thyrsiflorum TaxID=117978 RepID=A0ABD0U5K7_DENTH